MAVTASLVLLAALALVGIRIAADRIVLQEACTATAGGAKARVSIEQAENAAIIASVAARRGLPARAATIALATALQESGLRNLDYGDRDSLGLFQQRPSQGWGTEEQVQDPVYAAGKFYDALVKIPDYKTMNINDAAQKVQRSGHPEAYNKHETRARALASTLMGYSPAAFSCAIRTGGVDREEPNGRGLTPRAQSVLDEVQDAFGPQSTGGYAPGGVDDGHMEGSAHYDGRAVDIFYRPVNATARRVGWATAQWLVAHADRLDVATVIYDGRIWTARRSIQGWRDYTPPGGDTANATLMHRDHVHVDVR
ncbi:heavy metal transporter [Sporichthya brevicatena]|uniref:Heavy metal transporter n=1 Tax=Sporichthya brevicatena TaxID=171442 RepID=A0ABN1G629_9ACTN